MDRKKPTRIKPEPGRDAPKEATDGPWVVWCPDCVHEAVMVKTGEKVNVYHHDGSCATCGEWRTVEV